VLSDEVAGFPRTAPSSALEPAECHRREAVVRKIDVAVVDGGSNR